MTSSFDTLPAILAEIAEVAGLQAALEIARRFGGARLSVPLKAKDDHPLVLTIGREAADKLCDHFRVGNTGAYLEIPLGPAGFYASLSAEVDKAKKAGLSDDQVARQLRISRRTVLRHRKRQSNNHPRLL